jgi:hypothetical protein
MSAAARPQTPGATDGGPIAPTDSADHGGGVQAMSVTASQDFTLADRDREWDAAAAENRVRQGEFPALGVGFVSGHGAAGNTPT